MNFSWQDIPHAVAVPLLKGSVGSLHLRSAAEAALQHAAESAPVGARPLLELGAHCLLAAWEGDMLDPGAADQLLQLHGIFPFLTPVQVHLARIISQTPPPGDVKDLRDLLMSRDIDPCLRHVEGMRRREPDSLFWVRQGIMLGMVEGRHDWTARWISTSDLLPVPLREGLLGDVNFARGEWLAARGHYLAARRGVPSLVWLERQGEAAWREGRGDEALAQWDVVLARRPWHTNLFLRRDDVLHERYGDGPYPSGKGTVLLYTWNKDSSLDMTLRSLAASNLGDADIVVLDNGSTDGTAEVITAWVGRMGSRVRRVDLPCNVGAPAARNWLLTLPENRVCDWVAFVDDDVELPANWLHLLGRAMAEYPDHPVYGCRVVNHDTPMNLQSVDLHIDEGGLVGSPEGGEMGQEPGHRRRFSVSGIHHLTLDFGNFSYMRPCLSVTGCCHLFRREALDRVGHFDLRFSPSQYDDLEHDVRHALYGQWPLYQGHLCVRHMKRSGRGAWTDAVQLMSAWANLFKLQTRYTREQYQDLRREEHALLLADMLARQKEE